MSEQSESRAQQKSAPFSAEKLAELADGLRAPLGGIESSVAGLAAAEAPADQEALVARLKQASAELRSAAGALLQPRKTASASPKERPVLILDSDAGHARLLATTLGHLGHPTERVASLEATLAFLARNRCAAIFMATETAEDDFWNLRQAIAAADPALPVVGLVRQMTPARQRNAMDCGANWVIEAPSTVHDLRQALVAIGVRDPMLRQVAA